jgi:hypothetical protein
VQETKASAPVESEQSKVAPASEEKLKEGFGLVELAAGFERMATLGAVVSIVRSRFGVDIALTFPAASVALALTK